MSKTILCWKVGAFLLFRCKTDRRLVRTKRRNFIVAFDSTLGEKFYSPKIFQIVYLIYRSETVGIRTLYTSRYTVLCIVQKMIRTT